MYALIQVGHTIFGIGDTITAARADAMQWLDGDQTDVSAVPAFKSLSAMFAQTVHGELAIVPCSPALAAHVADYGTVTYDDSGEVLRLPSERDAQSLPAY